MSLNIKYLKIEWLKGKAENKGFLAVTRRETRLQPSASRSDLALSKRICLERCFYALSQGCSQQPSVILRCNRVGIIIHTGVFCKLFGAIYMQNELMFWL